MTQSHAPTRRRNVRTLLTLFLAGLAVYLLLPQLSTLKHSMALVNSLGPLPLVLAAFCQLLSYLGSGLLLHNIASLTGQDLSPFHGMVITMASNTLSTIGGGLIGSMGSTYRWMRNAGASPEAALLAGWMPGLFEDLLLVGLALLGMFLLLLQHALTTYELLSFIVAAALVGLAVLAAIWAARRRKELTRIVGEIAKRWAAVRQRPSSANALRAAIERGLDALELVVRGGWRGSLLGTAMNIVFDLGTLFFIFAAAGELVPPGILLVGYGLPLLFGKLPILPGGVGLVEGTMTALYAGMGISTSVTVVVVLTYRLLSFWLPTGLGVPLIPFLERKPPPTPNLS